MKTRNILAIMSFLCGSMSPAMAQNSNDFDFDDEEIVVQTENGEEEIIELPVGMTLNIDSLLNDYNAKMYLKTDDNCNFENVNPSFEREVFMDRLKRLPTEIEMPWNAVVQKFIDRYAQRDRRGVGYMLGASNFYFPIFEQALEAYGLPLELKYLPVIESALKPKTTSHVGATGLWQFMLETGKNYGLRVTTMIDERCDPIKSSYAAAHYLSDLYKIFGDWNLVLAAYNYGPGNVKKAIHRAGGERDYWKIYPYLPSETRGYVPAFIAANYIMNYYCEHNICPMRTTLPLQTDTIMLYRDVHFKQISQVLGISIEELRTLNPQYRRDVITGYSEPTDLRLPVDYINQYLNRENEILGVDVSDIAKRTEVEIADEPSRNTRTRATSSSRTKVTSSDDSSNSSSNYSSSSSSRRTRSNSSDEASSSRRNSSSSSSSSKSSRSKKESSKESKSSKSSKSSKESKSSKNSKSSSKNGKQTSSSKKKSSGSSSITIKEGDNLSRIAERNHTTVAKLKKLNGLTGDNIRAGKTLKVK